MGIPRASEPNPAASAATQLAIKFTNYRREIRAALMLSGCMFLVHRMVPYEGTFKRHLKDGGLFDPKFRAMAELSDVEVKRHWFTASCVMWGPKEGAVVPSDLGLPSQWRQEYTGVCSNLFIPSSAKNNTDTSG